MKAVRLISTGLIACLLLGAAVGVSWWLLKTAPTTEPGDKERQATIVQVIDLKPRDERITVTVWGEVIPSREVVIRPQVEGRIVRHHPELVPGGRLKKGEEVAGIDPADYELALEEREAEFEEARYEADIEEGRQLIAKREWEELKKELSKADVNPSLALREPHLRRTEAMLARANAAIGKARLDLERTALAAPFNSMVTEESVEIGQLIREGADICQLVGTDEFWVRATLPVGELKWVRFPEGETPGSAADVHLDSGNGNGGGTQWPGEVVRLLSDLETNGRMARVLVSVTDPLGLNSDDSGRLPLLLGSYVRVEIEAGRLENVLAIPRSALREGNHLWVVDPENKLKIVEPEILWTRQETVLVPNLLEPGERLVVSELKAALPGMAVSPQRLAGSGNGNNGGVSK